MSVATAPDHRSNTPSSSDLYAVDRLLGDEERLVRDSVRQFVHDHALPVIAAHYADGTFPRHLVRGLATLGLFGMQLDGFGCAGASPIAYGVACEELEAGDSALRSFVSVQGSLAMYAISTFGSADQKQQWLPAMAVGDAIGCFALTEPDAGSDPGAMRTHARRDGSDWVLHGTKMWITNGSIADVAIVWAQTDSSIRGFLVESGTRGFASHDVPNKLSLRASVTSELSLDGVRVPNAAVLPDAIGLNGPLSCLSEARFGIVWGAMGAARSCFEAALTYSGERSAFGKPLSARQLTQEKLADMATALVYGRLLALRLAVLKQDNEMHSVQVSLGKRANVRAALSIARSARSILGANGITLEYPVARHMANLESVLTYEGTDEVHALIIGRHLTGEDAFS